MIKDYSTGYRGPQKIVVPGTKKTMKYVALASVLTLGLIVLGNCNNKRYEKKFNNLVNIQVDTENATPWATWSERDKDGDRRFSVSWQEFLYDAHRANDVDSNRRLEELARKNGTISIPRADINPKYDL